MVVKIASPRPRVSTQQTVANPPVMAVVVVPGNYPV